MSSLLFALALPSWLWTIGKVVLWVMVLGWTVSILIPTVDWLTTTRRARRHRRQRYQLFHDPASRMKFVRREVPQDSQVAETFRQNWLQLDSLPERKYYPALDKLMRATIKEAVNSVLDKRFEFQARYRSSLEKLKADPQGLHETAFPLMQEMLADKQLAEYLASELKSLSSGKKVQGEIEELLLPLKQVVILSPFSTHHAA